MPVPLREQVLAGIIDSVGGQYGLELPTDDRRLPLTLVRDTPETATEDYDQVVCVMPVAVAMGEKATTQDEDQMRTQANDLLATLITAMFADETFGGLVKALAYTGGGIEIGGRFVGAEATFDVTYSYLRGDPFTSS